MTDHRSRTRTSFWIIVGTLIASGIIALLPFWPHHEYLEPVGHALLIAGLLAGTVDLYLKDRLVREVTEDTARFLIGFNLPEALRDRIQEVLWTKLVRRDYELTYAFDRIEEDPNKLLLTTTASWTFDNVSNDFEIYSFSYSYHDYEEIAFVEVWVAANVPLKKYIAIPKDIVDERALGAKLERAKLTVKDNSGHHIISGLDLRIPPHNMRNGIAINLGFKWTCKVATAMNDKFQFAAPTLGVTARVSRVPPDIEVHATTEAPEQMDGKRWVYKRSFFPGEVFTLRWKKTS